MKQRRYVVDLVKLWPDIFSSIPGDNEIEDLVGFIEDYPDLEFPNLVERTLTQDEMQFCTDYSTYRMCNPSPTKKAVEEEELFVYQGFLVRKTGRAAAKDTAQSQLRRRTTTKPQDILIEVSTVDAIPPFSKWIKDTELYKVL